MITFNNIVERFEVFATNHFFIKSFSFGSPDDVDLSKFEEFPLMHLVYTGATYDAGTKIYNLEVYILDVPNDKKGKVIPQKEAISDAEQCAEDIIADIRSGGNIFRFAEDYEVVNATTTPLEEETKNVLSGILLDISVAIPYEWDACNAPLDGVTPGGGTEPGFARRGFLRMLTLDGSTDVLSVRTINVTNGTLTDDGDGVVTLDTGGVETLEELTDVNIIGEPDQGDVISYNTGTDQWMRNGGLQQLLARFKASGTGAQMYDTLNDTTKGYVDILADSATMKVNNSGMTITEASPGVLSLSVAAGTEGNEVEFEAFVITGSDTSTTASDIVFKYGSKTYWEIAGGKKIFLRALNVEEITVVLPSTGGQLALTTQIPDVPVDSVNGQTGAVVLDTGDIDENGNLYYTEARVEANSAVVANTAKVGITTQQASDITANNAKTGITSQQASDITANNAKTGITSGQASAITANTAKVSYTDGAVDLRIAAADIGDLNDVPATIGTTGQVLAVNTGANALEYVNQSGGGGTSFDYARAIMGSDVLQGGASQQDFDSATPQKVKFNTSADTEGTGITIDTTNNRITVAVTGYYNITSNMSFFSGSGRTTPASIFKVNGSTDLLGEGFGYIRAASGQNDNNNLITCTVELQANDYVEVWTGDSSTVSGQLFATQAFFELSGTGGATGPTGTQGPSGTTYDVVTLTGSTTLSSAHTTKYLVVNSATNVTLTVPSTASYDTYAEFVIEQRGAGSVTVVAASGVTVNSSETLVSGGQFAVMGLKRTASNVYTLTGERQAI